jgi:2-iminobutanoate/2-iminopropanoate deaminase
MVALRRKSAKSRHSNSEDERSKEDIDSGTGSAPNDPQTGTVVGATIQEQTRQCLRNIQAILEAAGSSLDKVVSVTVVLADEEDFPGMNEEWLKWFPSNPPARQGAKMPVKAPGLRVSIAAVAEA